MLVLLENLVYDKFVAHYGFYSALDSSRFAIFRIREIKILKNYHLESKKVTLL